MCVFLLVNISMLMLFQYFVEDMCRARVTVKFYDESGSSSTKWSANCCSTKFMINKSKYFKPGLTSLCRTKTYNTFVSHSFHSLFFYGILYTKRGDLCGKLCDCMKYQVSHVPCLFICHSCIFQHSSLPFEVHV